MPLVGVLLTESNSIIFYYLLHNDSLRGRCLLTVQILILMKQTASVCDVFSLSTDTRVRFRLQVLNYKNTHLFRVSVQDQHVHSKYELIIKIKYSVMPGKENCF